MSNENKNNLTLDELEVGLNPMIQMTHVGSVYVDTTQGLSEKARELMSRLLKITELDNVSFIPKMSRSNSAGIEDIRTFAYFNTSTGGNIFFRGKKSNRSENGRINMVATAGIAAGGTGPFGTSAEFRQQMSAFCLMNENGKALLNLKAVPRHKNLAVLELDTNAVLCLLLGIKPEDNYDFDIMEVVPIGGSDSTNFSITIMKYVAGNNNKKGKYKTVNYSALEQEQFRRFNGGGNKGNRNY